MGGTNLRTIFPKDTLVARKTDVWDLDDAKWDKVQEVTMSLRPQVGGFFDYGGTFNGMKNGEMLAMCGIGDWITGAILPVDRIESTAGPAMLARIDSGTCESIGRLTRVQGQVGRPGLPDAEYGRDPPRPARRSARLL